MDALLLVPLVAGLVAPVVLRRRAPRPSRAFVPAVSVALAEVCWRVVVRLIGALPDRGPTIRPAEWSSPWQVALVVTGLCAWLVVRPGRGPAVALGVVETARALATALPLAVLAAERLGGWGIFDPARPDEPWVIESVHLALHVGAAALLVPGYRGYLADRERARLAAAADAF
jgi:hypothetical protein